MSLCQFATFICLVATGLGAAGASFDAVDAPLNARLNRTNLLQWINPQGQVTQVRTLADWQARRRLIRAAMEELMGAMPGQDRRCPLEVVLDDEVDCGSYVRRCLSYRSEPGSRVPAYLLIPKRALLGEITCPGTLCLHQTHTLGQEVVVGLGANPTDEYAVELVRRGYVCLAPAYPLLANYHPDLKALGYQSGTMKAIWDNSRGLDLLESLSFVRKGGYGAIGHSLGGHNSVYTAVFDERIKVIVSSCGLDAYRDYMGGNITGWTSERYMPRLLRYRPSEIPFDFPEMIGMLAPRTCLLSAPTGDANFKWWSVDAVAQAAFDAYDLYGAPQNLRVEHPNCGHLFPRDMRELAYRLFDEHLRPEPERR